jgi:hypothetical protein
MGCKATDTDIIKGGRPDNRMIGCGIEIVGRRAICVALGVKDGQMVDLTGRQRPLAMGDDEDPVEVRRFQQAVQACLAAWRPDRIGILQRKKIGTFAAGGLTFKMEGLIQLYPHRPVEIVPSATIRAFTKEHQPPMNPRYAYQKNAYLLACYLVHPTTNGNTAGKIG